MTAEEKLKSDIEDILATFKRAYTIDEAINETLSLAESYALLKVAEATKEQEEKCEICGREGVSKEYCPNCSWHFNPIP